MKGLPMLRVMIFGVLTLLMVSFAYVFFAEGYLYYNGGPQNATLLNLFYNVSNRGGLYSNKTATLNNQLVSQGGSAANLGSAEINTGGVVGLAASFFTSLPTTASAMLNAFGSVFGVLGLDSSYFFIVGGIMLIAIIVLVIITILSVIYL